MTTVRDLIKNALKENEVLAVGEVPSDEEYQDALDTLNLMLDTWAIERLMVYGYKPNVFPLTASQSAYTIGTGGNFNVARPEVIGSAFARDAQGNDLPIFVTTDYTEYANIISKQVTSTLPYVLYDDNGSPLRTLTLWPVPGNGVYSLVLWLSSVLASFALLDDVIQLPSGYQNAIVTNLAVRLCPRYGKNASAELAIFANNSKAWIKTNNMNVATLAMPNFLRGGGYFDTRTGNWVYGDV